MKSGSEITTLQEFNKIKDECGFVIITDKDTGDHIHKTTCRTVKDDKFSEKVISNKKKYGQYFWYDSYSQAQVKYPRILVCKICKH